MDIIYSYKRILYNKKELTPAFWNMAKLSVTYANRFYNTILYCDTKTKKLFESNEIPINEYRVLTDIENYNGVIYPMPKLYGLIHYCNTHPNQPFFHIDLDTIIINKLTEPSESIGFSHPEINLKKRVTPSVIEFLQRSYIKPYEMLNLSDQIGEYDFSFVPNYNIIYIKNGTLAKKYLQELVDIITSNKVLINGTLGDVLEAGVSQLLEQYTFYHLLKRDKINTGLYSKYGTFDFLDGWVRLGNDIIKDDDVDIVKLQKYDYLHLSSYDVFLSTTNKIVKLLMNDVDIIDSFKSTNKSLL
jgi:hypothetical protein